MLHSKICDNFNESLKQDKEDSLKDMSNLDIS